jgi:hypothetical protein
MEWSDLLTPTVLAPGGLIALFVVMIYTGKLVPRWQVERMEAQADLEITHLKQTVDTLTASTALFAKAAEASTQTANIVQTVLESLQAQSASQQHQITDNQQTQITDNQLRINAGERR